MEYYVTSEDPGFETIELFVKSHIGESIDTFRQAVTERFRHDIFRSVPEGSVQTERGKKGTIIIRVDDAGIVHLDA